MTAATHKNPNTATDQIGHALPINLTKQDMTQSQIQATENFRERDHRFTALPIKDILKIRMKDLSIKNSELQRALGYPMPNVIAMMKTGSMRLPSNKVPAAAQLLQVDPKFLLAKVIAENDPELWDVIASLLGDQLITANEMDLIALVRQGLDGHDVSLAQSQDFVQAITPCLAAIVQRENALAQAAINRTDN